VLIALLAIVMLCAIAFGAVKFCQQKCFRRSNIFLLEKTCKYYEGVFIQLRLPRVLLCAITGAILAVSGVLMQGLFRNPIVEPGLIGTSSGAAFGASVVFALAAKWSPQLKSQMGPDLLLHCLHLRSIACYLVSLYMAKNAKSVSIIHYLLIGIAINAMGLSGTGL
jgi:iron complex transport system permease protein